jgi:CheY-like chemotaxis protein
MNDRRRTEEEMVERRRYYRAGLETGAVVHAAKLALKGRIIDLSLGGVRIRRADDTAPCPAPGTAAMVEMEIGEHGWIAADGFVVRAAIDEIVISFAPLAAEVEDLIEDEVLAAIEASRRPRMIVVDQQRERRRRVADKLRAAGCDSYEAATPLEAIDLMERPRSHIKGVAVAEHLTQTGGDEFCDFVHQTNPNIKLALLAEQLADGTVDQPIPRAHRISDRIPTVAVVENDETMDRSLKGFVDSVATRPGRGS